MNEGTNGQTNRQLTRGPSEPSGARKRPWGARDLERAWSRAITGPRQPRHYPQLSACVLKLGFRAPSGGQNPRESHREASRPKRPAPGPGARRYGEHGRKGWRCRGSTGAPAIHYVASAVRHGSISPFWRGAWSARLFLRPQKPRDRSSRILCGDHRGECQDFDGCGILKYLN